MPNPFGYGIMFCDAENGKTFITIVCVVLRELKPSDVTMPGFCK